MGRNISMFKKSNFSTEAEDLNELQVFKNIRKPGIFGVASHPVVFSYVDSITWILKNTNMSNRYICIARKEPIASFRPKYLSK
jgi:hypothetical protein